MIKDSTYIQQLFSSKGGILGIKELQEAGISYYFLNKLIDRKFIRRIKQGVYAWQGEEVDERQEVVRIIPKGVFCLHSAAFFHELSTFVPVEHHIAIPWKSKVRLPDYPPVKLYYWQEPQFTVGLTHLLSNEEEVPIYDKEKTVCDFLKFRNKVGMDATKEVLKSYLNLKERNIQKVMVYARKLKIYSTAKQYLEVLI